VYEINRKRTVDRIYDNTCSTLDLKDRKPRRKEILSNVVHYSLTPLSLKTFSTIKPILGSDCTLV